MTFLGSTLVERTRTATIERTAFQSWNLAVGFRFLHDFWNPFSVRCGSSQIYQPTAQIVSYVLSMKEKLKQVSKQEEKLKRSESLFRSTRGQTKIQPTRKYSVERPCVNNHYVLYSLNATFCIICEHRSQQDQCLWTARATMLGCLLKETRSCRKNRNTILRDGDVCSMKTNAVKTALPLVLKFYSALTCE